MTNKEKTIAILNNTKDGEGLSPQHLRLVQFACNDSLSKAGTAAFAELYEAVSEGNYKKPWFHNIPNLTIDHLGFVCWKGQRVEHYAFPWAFSKDAEKQATELAERCKYLEQIGSTVDISSAVISWDQNAYSCVQGCK